MVDLGHVESGAHGTFPVISHLCEKESRRCDTDLPGGENVAPSTQDRPQSQPVATHSQSPAVALDGNSHASCSRFSHFREQARSPALRELCRERYNGSPASKDTAAAARPLQ